MITLFWVKFKKYIIGAIILIALYFLISYMYKTIVELRKENSRYKSNIENMSFDIEKTQLKNGELQYTVKALTLKNNEIEFFAKDVYEKLNEMDLKLKNVKGVTNLNYTYNTYIDTLKSEKISDFKYLAKYDTNNFKAIANINLSPDNSFNPYLSDVSIKLTDSLLIVPEYEYKRRWIFWRKVVGVKVHIKSENPNFELNQVKSFEITK